MKALIAPSGQVAEVVADDKTFPVHSDLSWVDCDGTVTTEHTYDGAVFVAPVVPDPPTALEVWEREAARLDNELVSLGSLARTIEDLATDGAVSQARKALLAGTIAARVAHRLAKPA